MESSSLPFHHLTGLTPPPPPVSPPPPDLDTVPRSMCQRLLINLRVRDKLELHNFSVLCVCREEVNTTTNDQQTFKDPDGSRIHICISALSDVPDPGCPTGCGIHGDRRAAPVHFYLFTSQFVGEPMKPADFDPRTPSERNRKSLLL